MKHAVEDASELSFREALRAGPHRTGSAFSGGDNLEFKKKCRLYFDQDYNMSGP